MVTVTIHQANTTGKQQEVNKGPFSKKDPFNASIERRRLDASMASGAMDLTYSGYGEQTYAPYATEVGQGSDITPSRIAPTVKPEIPADTFKKNDKPRAQEFVAPKMRKISDDSDSDVIGKKPVETKVAKPVTVESKPAIKQLIMEPETKEPIKPAAAPIEVKQPVKPMEAKQPTTPTAPQSPAANKPDNTSNTGTWIAGATLAGLALGALMMNGEETTNAASTEYNKDEEAPYFNKDIEMMKLPEESSEAFTEEPSGYMSSEIEDAEQPLKETYEEIDLKELY